MNIKNHKQSLDRKSFLKIRTAIESIHEELSFLKNTPLETMNVMDNTEEERWEFILEVTQLIRQYPLLIPPSMSMNELASDITTIININNLRKKISRLENGMYKEMKEKLSFVFDEVLHFYDSANEAASVDFPGAQQAIEKLNELLPEADKNHIKDQIDGLIRILKDQNKGL